MDKINELEITGLKEKIETLEKRINKLEEILKKRGDILDKIISNICSLKYKPSEHFPRDDNMLVLNDNVEITDEFAKDLYQNTFIFYKYKD